MDPFVPKRETRTPGDQTCAYKGPDMAAYCGKPATWHVMWDGERFDNSVTCDNHMELVRRRWVYDDRHPVGADCTMPGALWLYREERCAFSADEPTLAVARAISGGKP